MDKLIFNDATYDVAVNGIMITKDVLKASLVADDFYEVESTVAPVEEIVQTLSDGTMVSTYKGYTVLASIDKRFHQIIDYYNESHEESVPIFDPDTGEVVIDIETGEPKTETVIITDSIPIYDDIFVVTLFHSV